MNKINIAILGYGTVGKALFNILSRTKEVNIKYVFDFEFKRSELKELLQTDYNVITEDENIGIVFEAMGGDKLPYTIVKKCLENGKNVISSNKEMVSKHIYELTKIAEKNYVSFLYEAAVGGGIPLIKPLMEIRKFDCIESFLGILNGTTNFILTKISEGMEFGQALKLAQEKGYAEKDPTSDLDGTDLKRKGIILSTLCFNKVIKYDSILSFGIKFFPDELSAYIEENKLILKMGVMAKNIEDKIYLYVGPMIVKNDSILSKIKNENNAFFINSKLNGPLSFIGKGAGGDPTASAMMQDMFTILDGGISNSIKNKEMEFSSLSEPYLVLDSNELIIKNISNINDLKEYPFVARILVQGEVNEEI